MEKQDVRITITLTQDEIASIFVMGGVMIRLLDAAKLEMEKQELDVQDEIDRIFKAGESQQ